MNDQPFDVAAIVDAMAPLLGVTITEGHKPGVVVNLELIARMARLVLEHDLGDHAEPAPVFVA